MIDARTLIKYSASDHAIHLFINVLDCKLRAARATRINRVLTVVMYDTLKESTGFFSPRIYKPTADPSIDWFYRPAVKTWFTEPMFETLTDVLNEYGYNVRTDVHESAQVTRAVKLTITW